MILINYFLQLLINKVPATVRRRLKFERNQMREVRLKTLNDAYKRRHGEIGTAKNKKLKLPKVDILRADGT